MTSTPHPECPKTDPHLLHTITVGNGLQVTCPGFDPEEEMPETPRLSEKGSQAVRQAFAQMPYSADPRVMRGPVGTAFHGPRGLSEVALIEALKNLVEVLREHADRNNRMEQDYLALKSDVRAFRRVLGTDRIQKDEL